MSSASDDILIGGRKAGKLSRFADEMKRMMDDVAARTDSEIAYIVIDPIGPRAAVYCMTDEGGRKFAQMHPSVIDGLPRASHPEREQGALWGTPIYERHQLPEGWGVPAFPQC